MQTLKLTCSSLTDRTGVNTEIIRHYEKVGVMPDPPRTAGGHHDRLFPPELSSGVPAFLYAVLETNMIRRDKNKVLGRVDPNSGGTSIFLTPGIQYVTRRYILEVAVQIPVAQFLNGNALENDYVARTGFRWNF